MTDLQVDAWRVFVSPLPGTVRAARPDLWRSIVDRAAHAPSLYNTQPWRFRVRRGALEIRPDLSRALPVADPIHRRLVMSCGAALENVRLELACRGIAPRVELLPDAADPLLLARVRPGAFRPASALEESLRAAIARRRSTRGQMSREAVALSVVEQLTRCAASEGITLDTVQDGDRSAVAALISEGTRLEGNSPAFRGELAYWLRRAIPSGPDEPPVFDGFPLTTLGFPAPLASLGIAAVRSLPWGILAAPRARRLVLRAPRLLLLSSPRDGERDWIAAGMSLQRILLMATARGLSAGFLDAPIASPTLRARLRDRLGLPGIPQTLLRLGRARSAQVAIPRRPIRELLSG